ncbi:single-strand binding protein [Hathewaya proteolytica DSM 3090]|uniref:Single-stranded DNA-binding protein n=1 Tax=Hathewaya proteolytica DSM 3090 TaxID=1121331 RepID=A0A1M6NE77_9CLOT|nr:single-stranded DNA-binding protein [Hathewaya proteolytica]SHJ93876.1 single-strand binding protein [Hathewaya proteolytica DSM 3090]
MNKIFLIGRLTKDAELKETQENKKKYTKFALAVEREKAKDKEADFFNVALWGNIAESLAPYLNKGKLVSVIGTLRNSNYENSEGEKKYYTEIVAEEIKLLESKQKAQ